MKRAFIGFGLFALLSQPAFAQVKAPVAPTVLRADVTSYGIYRVSTMSSRAAQTASGHVRTLRAVVLQRRTRTIPARFGVAFGFQYVLRGAPAGAMVHIRLVNFFPAPGIRNPSTLNTYRTDAYDTTTAIGGLSYKGYILNHSWEIVPGVWTFQIWYQGRKIAQESFTLVRP